MPVKPLILGLVLCLLSATACPAQGTAGSARDAVDRERGIERFIDGEHEAALAILEPLARRGDPIAQYIMAYAFEEGLGRAANLQAAIRWYERAAAGGHLEAMVRLGEMYALGYGVARQDDARALDYMTMAAGHGYPLAQHFLGMFSLWGILGVERDIDTALSWVGLAAAQGYGPSISIKGALEMPAPQRAALIDEMGRTRNSYAARQVVDFGGQAACLDELKSWSFQAASLYFALIVVEERPEQFFAALVGGGAPFSPLGESYWECSAGRLRLWH